MSADVNSYTILYFLDYGKGFGGAANTLLQQAVLMKQAGYNTIVFFSDYFGTEMNDEYKIICESLEIEYQWATYQISSQTEDIDFVCLNENYEKLKEKIVSCRPNILHSVQINPGVELISRECRIPHIMNIYPLIPGFFSLPYMDVFPHYHICDSWFYAYKWQQFMHTDSTCIRTVVNTRIPEKRDLPGLFLRCICVGAIYSNKNQLAVIEAFHRALQSGIKGRLTLCGYVQGEYGQECIRYIEKNGLQHDIIIKGFCSDMNYEYLQHDILICGSKRESYPNAISEGMANGLVVISTPVAGVPEVIVDGENGYLSRDCSADALYEKVMQVQADIKNGKIVKVISKMKETFFENHLPGAVTKDLLRYYQYVVNDYEYLSGMECAGRPTGIAGLRTVFASLLEMFYQNQRKFSEPDKAALKIWYLYHIQGAIAEALRKRCDFYIWGTGKYGIVVKEMVEIFMPEIHIAGFLDSNRTGEFQGYKIYLPEEILQGENRVIFIAAMKGQEEMIEQLEEKEFCFNRDYFILSPRSW